MQVDLNSPLRPLSEYLAWLKLPVTLEVLQAQEVQAQALNAPVHKRVPDSLEAVIKREQSIGEIKGLQNTESMVYSWIDELKPRKDELND